MLFVHYVFESIPLFAPILPNMLSDWSKNYPNSVRGSYNTSVKKLAQTHKNSGFYTILKTAPFFLAHPALTRIL